MRHPKKFGISEIKLKFQFPLDIFICSSSYEERCRTIPNELDVEQVGSVLICENEDLKDVVGSNTEYLINKFGAKATRISLSTNGPLIGADNIQKALKQVVTPSTRRILVDITTFTHESLLIFLKLVHQFAPGIEIQCAYTTAAEYSVGLRQEDKWLSKGIGEIRSVLGYPGILLPSRKTHLIVLVGFERERAEKLIAAYEPAVLSLGFAEAEHSISEALHDVNKYFHWLLSQQNANVREFTFSCVNPCETKKSIQSQIATVPDHNVIVAPMNTKISSIGAALAAFGDETIQLCYAHANQYNFDGYSLPGSECYLFSVVFEGQC